MEDPVSALKHALTMAQGEVSIDRIRGFKDKVNFTIHMSYGLVLI